MEPFRFTAASLEPVRNALRHRMPLALEADLARTFWLQSSRPAGGLPAGPRHAAREIAAR